MLTNYVAPSVYEYIADCNTYESAITVLKELYVKPKNEIYARHVLATRRQETNESIDTYLQILKRLSKDCNFTAVTAEQHRQSYIRDAFINGLYSKEIRQRLLENMTLTLDQAFEQARSLEMAYKNSETYNQLYPSSAAVEKPIVDELNQSQLNAISSKNKCFFCGLNKHPRNSCPAKDSSCNSCGKIGHYARVCTSKASTSNTNGSSAAIQLQLPTLATIPGNKNSNGYVTLLLNNKEILALVDSGSTSSSFIVKSLVQQHKMKVIPAKGEISLANSSLTTKIEGECLINFTLDDRVYENHKVLIMENLCADIILGQDFMERHKSVVFTFNGKEPTLKVCALTPMKLPLPSLFTNLSSDCKPIAVKSRRHSKQDEEYIKKETQRMLDEGIIRPSKSPWRAQVLVTKETKNIRSVW